VGGLHAPLRFITGSLLRLTAVLEPVQVVAGGRDVRASPSFGEGDDTAQTVR